MTIVIKRCWKERPGGWNRKRVRHPITGISLQSLGKHKLCTSGEEPEWAHDLAWPEYLLQDYGESEDEEEADWHSLSSTSCICNVQGGKCEVSNPPLKQISRCGNQFAEWEKYTEKQMESLCNFSILALVSSRPEFNSAVGFTESVLYPENKFPISDYPSLS